MSAMQKFRDGPTNRNHNAAGAVFAFAGLCWLAFIGALIWVAAHFIAKFW